MKQILIKASLDTTGDPENFQNIALLEVDCANRFEALEQYINLIKYSYKIHIIIVLDVITECISSFNETTDSLRLIDMLNLCINKHDVTFICLMHECLGVGNEKARGHLGSEITNKASTIIQVGFEKDNSGKPLDLIKISFFMCRNTRKPPATYAIYSGEEKGLVLANETQVLEGLVKKREKASIDEMKKEFAILLTGP